MTNKMVFFGLGVVACALAAPDGFAQLDYGIDFVTIGAPGNAGYNGPDPNGWSTGRGSVGYEYRIGRMEITTGQWMQFVNTFSTQSNEMSFFGEPNHWGARPDPNYGGPGTRWILRGSPDAASFPIFGITWRDAAYYCNWLNNGQPTDWEGIQNGAYDASTFTFNPDGTFNDQRTHNPDARFWIPTYDEWIKATHFDPDRNGEEQPGWWLYPHQSDSPPVPGIPGEGETSVGVRLPNFAHLDIPLGSYPDTLSPWGLLDSTGGAMEWTEETFEERLRRREFRAADGAYAGDLPSDVNMLDRADEVAAFRPTAHSAIGLRIASTIPAPGVLGVFVLGVPCFLRRRRPQTCSEKLQPGSPSEPQCSARARPWLTSTCST